MTTKSRREFLAKSLMDMVKLGVAAGLTTGFFAAFGLPVKVAIGMGVLVLFFAAWFLFPPKGGQA